MTLAGTALWLLCALLATIGALLTVSARRPLRAAMGLLMHIIALAGLYLAQHAELLAALQLIVYAGAVVVLFVFVIMMIGPASEVPLNTRRTLTGSMAIACCIALAFPLITAWSSVSFPIPAVADDFGGLNQIGIALYQNAWVPFELISITLLVAIIGAIAIAMGKGEKT